MPTSNKRKRVYEWKQAFIWPRFFTKKTGGIFQLVGFISPPNCKKVIELLKLYVADFFLCCCWFCELCKNNQPTISYISVHTYK